MNAPVTIVSARWVIPVEPQNVVLEDHAVVMEGTSIKEICATSEALDKFPGATRIDRPHHALVPGFVNSHTHAAMCLFRGLADDYALADWLNDHIWPAEAQWVDAEFVRDGTQLAIAEMLLSGTTSFTDMYFYPDIAARTTQELGMRATITMPVLDYPSPWGSGPDDYFEKGLRAHDELHALSRIGTGFAPHAPYTVSDEPLLKVRTLSDELNVPIHMHIHETAQEVTDAVAQTGKRPLQRLDDLGLLNPKMIAVHMTELDDSEIKLLAGQGVHVVHCPVSNAKLASGQCRVADLLAAGVNVCLGTDGAASNNNLDMIVEMRTAALGAKLQSGSAESLPAWQVLEMATINGAKATNQQHLVGSLVAGKLADMVAIDLNNIATQPVYDPVSQIVFSASREQVSDVWVGGEQLLSERKLSRFDLDQLLDKTAAWGSKIRNS
ncbi:MAG: TRZ/ATZ family hydrolase [Pseudomonadota bacterium]